MILYHYMIELTSRKSFIMDATDYWPFAHEYYIWNTSLAALQFWTEDLDPQTLSSTSERVYTAFFYSDSAQHLEHVEEVVLFGCFMTTLNNAFEWAFASEDIRYKCGSKCVSFPTPLHQEPWPFHVSTQENLSFGSTTPRACLSPSYSHTVCCWLSYKEHDEPSINSKMENHSPEDDLLDHHLPSIPEELDDDMEEHFLTVSLDDDVHTWKCTTWSVALPMSIWFESITPCSRRFYTVHISQGHLWIPLCYGICQW